MLVLSRKVGHRIVIAGDIEITVMQVRGNKVRLGVSAPREISIVRCESRRAGEATRNKLPCGPLVLASARIPIDSQRTSRGAVGPR